MLQTFDRGAVYRAFIIDCLRSVYPVHVLLAMDASTLANEIARGDAALFSGRNPERRAIRPFWRSTIVLTATGRAGGPAWPTRLPRMSSAMSQPRATSFPTPTSTGITSRPLQR
jgi:hypothetical protein